MSWDNVNWTPPGCWGQAREISLEREIPFRGDHYMLEAECIWESWGPADEDGIRDELCKPTFEFKLFQYNELTESYEVPVTDFTEQENYDLQLQIGEAYWDEQAAIAEEWYERRWER